MSKKYLSPSRISTYKKCSWIYWCKYHAQLPEKTNLGALKGTLCHLVFEVLNNPRHRKHYDLIIEKQDVFASKAVKQLIESRATKSKITEDSDFDDLKQMILKGLMYDFFGNQASEPTEIISEKDFELEIIDKEINYKIKGFIDRLFIYKDRGLVLVRDFKSSKKMYEGVEATDNMQDNVYALAIKKMYPEYSDIKIEFVFLKAGFENDGILKMECKSNQEFKAIEYELTEYQKKIDSFNKESATQNYAFDMGYPSDGTFSGALVCGRAKYPGHLKKDGTLMWHCPYKFPFDYWILINKDGKQVASAFSQEDLKLDKSLIVKKMRYSGCPRFNVQDPVDV